MPRYIDADASIEKVEKLFCQNCTPPKSTYCNSCRAKDVISFIQGLPIADVEPVRHGRWVNDTYCSACGRFPVDTSESISNRRLTKFFDRCPHCGAKMDGGESDEGSQD